MRSWASLGKNNNLPYTATIWWAPIKRLAPDADMSATLRHSCWGPVGMGGMESVTIDAILRFGLGRHRRYFSLFSLVSFWSARFCLPCLVFF